jgi:AcrR family transcriptional regulator
MPRITEEHRAQRREQVLAAARTCFIRDGFHQTSIADILAQGDLSTGAVYRYFKSKDEIIVAVAEDVIDRITGLLEPIVTQDPPLRVDEVVRQALNATDEYAFGERGFAALAPQVWAEALRNNALAQIVHRKYGKIHRMIADLVVAEQKIGRVAPDGDPNEIAKVLLGVIMGYIMQRLLIKNVTPDSYSSALAALVPPH